MEISTLAMYHCLAFVWYFFIAYTITNIRTEERPSEVFFYGGQWKYLTVLNLVLQAVFYGVSLLADMLRLIKKLRCAKCVISSRDLLFSVLAFPLSTHTAILPFAVLEILALPHRYPAKKKGLILLGFVSFLYISWVLWIYSVTGEWVYPLFALFSPAGLAAFFAVSVAIIISFYNFGEFLNHVIWGDSIVILDYRQKGK
ncbi:androgen-dependent TFPI-regulating protein isoform X2 [Neopsephotus bourkii]|uniref:androgen-dependent TFPI-regulating protein isoform X2 n=1 Tax=Neopsephotus bourkii TaxID=309878 RepID=UPI002AA4F79F|nr:androgen-dependent TFPI-regulating protein isoform X2 [Neopsephotus bourkii]